MFRITLLVFTVSTYFSTSSACIELILAGRFVVNNNEFYQNFRSKNGYEYKLHYFKPCKDDESNVMHYKDVSNKITNDCKLIPIGCMSTEGFKSATIHYKVDKKPMPPLEGDYDLCKGLESKDEFAMLGAKLMGLPDKCPVEKTEICGDGKKGVSIAKYKNKLGLAVGVTFVNITIKHDNGETCLMLKSEFKKTRKLG